MTSQPSVPVRCAVYTRKSTDRGLEQEFNSLDAQREACAAYIKSQAAEGWRCLPALYADGGFTGANLDRPALTRLLADVAQGRIDAVVVYKLDRLSRSLLDFARLMETFARHRVAFVSVTQQLNSATSMGRLVLHVLLSFAQFEREIVSERTRDKIAATRRKGKWAGGVPILGYDLCGQATKLTVNPAEAERVRAIFALYPKCASLGSTVHELRRRGWTNKRWQTRRGQVRGGHGFSKNSLHKLLTNVAYLGQVRHKREVFPGEQPAIVELEAWQAVQARLRSQAQSKAALADDRPGALLKGLLYCGACGSRMTPTHAGKQGKRYRYYLCPQRHAGSCRRVFSAAEAVEAMVLEQLRGQGWLTAADWAELTSPEKASRVRALVERIDYDHRAGTLSITLKDHIARQAQELKEVKEELYAAANY